MGTKIFFRRSSWRWLLKAVIDRILLINSYSHVKKNPMRPLQFDISLPKSQLSDFKRLLQIRFGYIQLIVSVSRVSNRNNEKWEFESQHRVNPDYRIHPYLLVYNLNISRILPVDFLIFIAGTFNSALKTRKDDILNFNGH